MKKSHSLISIKQQNNNKVFIACVIIFLLTSCSLPQNNSTNNLSETNLSTGNVNLLFSVTLPGVNADGERILIEILDEVTGLPYNSQSLEMKQVSELEVQLSYPFLKGSVIKYRYVKMGSSLSTEATYSGDPIRYRMAYAEGNLTISDNIQSWMGEKRNLDTGILHGTVIDSNSNSDICLMSFS